MGLEKPIEDHWYKEVTTQEVIKTLQTMDWRSAIQHVCTQNTENSLIINCLLAFEQLTKNNIHSPIEKSGEQ